MAKNNPKMAKNNPKNTKMGRGQQLASAGGSSGCTFLHFWNCFEPFWDCFEPFLIVFKDFWAIAS